jgi:ABC-type multidrug transport system fused ATPase/permease subunit
MIDHLLDEALEHLAVLELIEGHGGLDTPLGDVGLVGCQLHLLCIALALLHRRARSSS